MHGDAPHVHVVAGMLSKLREKRQLYDWNAFQEGDELGKVRAGWSSPPSGRAALTCDARRARLGA
jgi:hypothetical protein